MRSFVASKNACIADRSSIGENSTNSAPQVHIGECSMLFHVSVEADDPKGVAEALAQIMGGEAFPFPPVGRGSWVALAGDEFGSLSLMGRPSPGHAGCCLLCGRISHPLECTRQHCPIRGGRYGNGSSQGSGPERRQGDVRILRHAGRKATLVAKGKVAPLPALVEMAGSI